MKFLSYNGLVYFWQKVKSVLMGGSVITVEGSGADAVYYAQIDGDPASKKKLGSGGNISLANLVFKVVGYQSSNLSAVATSDTTVDFDISNGYSKLKIGQIVMKRASGAAKINVDIEISVDGTVIKTITGSGTAIVTIPEQEIAISGSVLSLHINNSATASAANNSPNVTVTMTGLIID